MYPLCRREHKTLGQRSPVTNVPMILQSYSWREAIASILFPESGHAPWSEAEQPGRWGAWGLGGLLGQLGLGGASAGGILLRVLLAWRTTERKPCCAPSNKIPSQRVCGTAT